MTPWWSRWVKRFRRQAGGGEGKTVSPKDPAFDQVIDEARKAWLQARHYFNNVTDPELIDHAIYEIVAAERKYMYLLRLAREERSAVEAKPEQEHGDIIVATESALKSHTQTAELESVGQSS